MRSVCSSVRLILFCLMLTVGMTGVRAEQATSRNPASRERGSGEELQPRVALTLDYVESLVQHISSEKDRSDYLSRLAEAWSGMDRSKSRDYFRSALNLINRMETGETLSSSAASVSWDELRTRRSSMLQKVAAVDPEFARILLEEDRERLTRVASGDFAAQAGGEARSKALADYAEILLEIDPQRSAELAIESLRDGLPPQFSTYLNELNRRQAGAADSVFAAALRQITASGTPDLNSLFALLGYVFPEAADVTPSMPILPSNISGTDTTKLLNALGAALVGTPVSGHSPAKSVSDEPLSAQERFDLIQRNLELFRRYAPDQVSSLENMAQRLGVLIPNGDVRNQPAWADSGTNSLHRFAPPGGVVGAGTASSRDESLLQEALEASRKGDWIRARQLSDRVHQAESRSRAKELVTLELAMGSVRSGDFDRAHQLAAELNDSVRRAEVLSFASERLIQQDCREEALRWLDEALNQGQLAPASTRKLRMCLGLLQGAIQLNENKAFEVAQWVVSILNRLESVASIQSKESRAGSKDQIGTKQALDGATIRRVAEASFGEDLEGAFEWLGQADFDQALLIVMQLQSDERRISVELSVCRGALAHLTRREPGVAR